MDAWIASLASVVLVSLVSFAGVLTLALKKERLKGMILLLVSFSTGALLASGFTLPAWRRPHIFYSGEIHTLEALSYRDI